VQRPYQGSNRRYGLRQAQENEDHDWGADATVNQRVEDLTVVPQNYSITITSAPRGHSRTMRESAVYARLLMRRCQRSSSTVQPLCFTFSHRVVGPPTRSTADDVHRAGNAGVITSRYTPRSSSAPTGCQAALVPVWRTAREYLGLHFLADLTRHEWPVVSFRVAGREVPLALVAPGQEDGERDDQPVSVDHGLPLIVPCTPA
jgi:hypothetical protein